MGKKFTFLIPVLVAVQILILYGGPIPCWGGLFDDAIELYKKGISTGNSTSTETIADSELVTAFKEALEIGTQKAVDMASRPGGFLQNPKIRIPLPGRLQSAADMLRRFGMASQVDAFETSMNTAAEKAAREALPVFEQAIKEMTFEDAKRLWKGGDTSITDYFKTKTYDRLYERFKPVVHETVSQVGVTQSYSNLVGSPTVKGIVGNTDLDLDHYVTDKTLDGLFKLLAEQERQIRENPAARTTELLKKVFGQ